MDFETLVDLTVASFCTYRIVAMSHCQSHFIEQIAGPKRLPCPKSPGVMQKIFDIVNRQFCLFVHIISGYQAD